MKRNTSPQFVGITQLKAKLNWQLDLFEAWAQRGEWMQLHTAHYDWWMFPIDFTSAYGLAYTVYEGDIAELKRDTEYLRNYLRGAQLVMMSWGGDMLTADYLPNPAPDQRWQHWPVRLFKAARSLQLFGYSEHFESLKKYARILMDAGEEMEYSGHDLSWLFTTGIDPRQEG